MHQVLVNIDSLMLERLCFVARRDMKQIDLVIYEALREYLDQPDIELYIQRIIEEEYKLTFCNQRKDDYDLPSNYRHDPQRIEHD